MIEAIAIASVLVTVIVATVVVIKIRRSFVKDARETLERQMRLFELKQFANERLALMIEDLRIVADETRFDGREALRHVIATLHRMREELALHPGEHHELDPRLSSLVIHDLHMPVIAIRGAAFELGRTSDPKRRERLLANMKACVQRVDACYDALRSRKMPSDLNLWAKSLTNDAPASTSGT